MFTLTFKSFNKPSVRQSLTSCLLGLSLLVTSTVLAAYKPPADQKPAPKDTRSEAGTTRGCNGSELPPTILASRYYVGRTASPYPTFAWFIDNTKPLSMKFYLYEVNIDSNGRKRYRELYQKSLQSSPGIMTLSLIDLEHQKLEAGKTYLWKVVVYCNGEEPASAKVDEAYLEVVEIPSKVQQQIEQTTNTAQKTDFYAQAGIWYDAFKEALKLAPTAKLGDLGTDLVIDLIDTETAALASIAPESAYEIKYRQILEKRLESLDRIAAQTTNPLTPTANAQ